MRALVLLLAASLLMPTSSAAAADLAAPEEADFACLSPGQPGPGVVGAALYLARVVASGACVLAFTTINAACDFATGSPCVD